MTIAAPFLLLNRTLLPVDEAGITPADRGFLLGDGLFETMRVSNGEVPLLDRHYQRLRQGCALLRLPPPALEDMRHDCHTLLEACTLHEGSIRFTLSRGPGPRGLTPPQTPQPTQLLTASPPPRTAPAPVRVRISTHRRNALSPLCQVKSLSVLPAILARLEAQEQGADDALMLNHHGSVTEASAATFLAHDGTQLITPPLHDGVLPGISRARLLEAGHCNERSLTNDALTTLPAAWLVTALSLTPIIAIDDHPLPVWENETERLRQFLYGLS